MSTRGRKADLKVIEGGLREMPAAPARIPEAMRPEWDFVVSDLKDRKLLTEAMLPVIETYVMALWNLRKAQEALDKHGVVVINEAGIMKQNPANTLLGKSQNVIQRLAAELGLTPAARSRDKMQGGKKDNDDDLLSILDL